MREKRMNFIKKSLLVMALAGAASVALAAEVQKVGVATASGEAVEITTADDGSYVVVVGGKTLAGAEAANFLAQEGITITVSPTGTIMGVDTKQGASVKSAPTFVATKATSTTQNAPISTNALPSITAASSATVDTSIPLTSRHERDISK